ncbi:MAG: recombinase family protein [Prochlorotrichaceae cyanobacterium]|jgi:hypothetical protein
MESIDPVPSSPMQGQKIRDGHARNRLNALPPPGRAPYGYKRGKERYAIDRTTAPVIKDFFEQFLLYGSLRGAVRYLAKRYGKKISTSTAQRWLTHPVYRGDLSYQDGEVVRDTHTPLISREEAAQIDRLLRRNRRFAPRTASADRSLAGLVWCERCGSKTTVTKVTIKGKSQFYLYLRPTQCGQKTKDEAGCKSMPYDRILAQVIEAICRTLPPAVANLQSSQFRGVKQQLERSLEEKQGILEQIPILLTQGILDESSAQLRTRTLRQEMAILRSQLEQLPPVNLQELVQAVAIPQFWQDLSESERRFFFREFIRRVEFSPDQDEISLRFVFGSFS